MIWKNNEDPSCQYLNENQLTHKKLLDLLYPWKSFLNFQKNSPKTPEKLSSFESPKIN